MSLIEQAVQRLEQLRRAGIDVPDVASAAPASSAPHAALAQKEPPPVRTSQQVTLDLDALGNAGIVTPSAPRSFVADQFRVIKRPLLTSAKATGDAAVHHGNLIMEIGRAHV